MPIIVNDFEIKLSDDTPQRSPRAESQQIQEAQDQGSQPQNPASNPALRPEDIEHILQRFARRRWRLRAD
jgi:hypothetical protein